MMRILCLSPAIDFSGSTQGQRGVVRNRDSHDPADAGHLHWPLHLGADRASSQSDLAISVVPPAPHIPCAVHCARVTAADSNLDCPRNAGHEHRRRESLRGVTLQKLVAPPAIQLSRASDRTGRIPSKGHLLHARNALHPAGRPDPVRVPEPELAIEVEASPTLEHAIVEYRACAHVPGDDPFDPGRWRGHWRRGRRRRGGHGPDRDRWCQDERSRDG